MKEKKGKGHSAPPEKELMRNISLRLRQGKVTPLRQRRIALDDIGFWARNRSGLGVSSDHLQILVSDLKDEMTQRERNQYVARKQSLSRPAGQPQLGSMFAGLGQRSLMVEYPEEDSAQYMCRSCLAARFIYN